VETSVSRILSRFSSPPSESRVLRFSFSARSESARLPPPPLLLPAAGVDSAATDDDDLADDAPTPVRSRSISIRIRSE
jgi:hypothetical protein